MKSFYIVDSAFRHGESSCHDRAPASFRWKWLDPEDGYSFPEDPIFFTDRDLHAAKIYHAGRKIGWLLEPRAIRPESYAFVEANLELFDVVLTFDRELIALDPSKFRFYAFGGCWIPDDQIRAYPKTKRCSIIASTKDLTEGQKLRHEVIRELGDKIDVYGRGYQAVDQKIDALRDYELTIVIENSIQDDYFSEKLIDALASGAVPLYWGSRKVDDYFPEGIHHFETIADLEELLETVKPVKASVGANLDRLHEFKIAEDYVWREHADLFGKVRTQDEPVPSAKLSDYLNGGKRWREAYAKLSNEVFSLEAQRNKARAERERYRFERDSTREERNKARAERDQAKNRKD